MDPRHAVQILLHMSAASSLADFRGDERCLALSASPAKMKAFLLAAARGMQLASQQAIIEARAAGLLRRVWTSLHEQVRAFTCDDTTERGTRVKLAVMVAKSGVVEAHEQLSRHLTGTIGPSAPAHVANLVAPHLELFVSLCYACPRAPGSMLTPRNWQAVQAAAGLAAAVLRSSRLRTAEASRAWEAAYHLAMSLCLATEPWQPLAPQVTDSGDGGLLLLMWLGLAAERLHQVSLPQQRQVVPAHHAQLLQALGVAAGAVHPSSMLATADVEYWESTVDSLLHSPLLASGAAAASCQRALLLLLLECAALLPTAEHVKTAARALEFMLQQWAGTPTHAVMLVRDILDQDAGMRALEAAGQEAAGAMQAMARLVAAANVQVVVRAGDDDGPLMADVAALWLERTEQYASLLEAGLRLQPHGCGRSHALAAASVAAAAARASRSADGGGGAGMSAGSQWRVFALLISAVKAATAEHHPTETALVLQAATRAWPFANRLGCVLLARCLVAASPHPSLLPVVQHAAAQLAEQAAAAEPRLEQLLGEHASAVASGEAGPGQLSAFGAAVCAALPVKQCCNYHGCRNLEQASELEVVSGEGCVCGSCRVARYCSRECQVAHYKSWHKAVCKRLQAQQAGEGCKGD